MEQYTEKQRKVCYSFYLECNAKGLNPLKNEAEAHRALLLGQQNSQLVKIFGGKLDGHQVDAYRIGEEYSDAMANEEEQNEKEEKLAKAKKVDEAAAALEKELAQQRGRGKREFFFKKTLEDAKQEYDELQKEINGSPRAPKQKESSWGTMGGIAAGITGSTAVGAMVAADTMMKNAEIRSSNAAMGSLANMALAALGWKKMTIQNKMDAIQKEKEKIKLHLMEERPQEELMEALQFSQPEANFTSSGTMLIYVTVSSKKQWKISGVDAVIDGSFLAEIYEGDRLIGCAYLNLPRDGIVETVSMEGHCPAAKPGGDYTVVIIPNALWLIEKYTPPQISYNDAYHVREQKYCDILDFHGLFKALARVDTSWKPIPVRLTWQQRLKEIEKEKSRKAEAEQQQKQRNKKMALIALLAVAVCIVVVMVLSNKQKEAERLDAYNTAISMAEAGKYDEAISAFEDLGDYKDSVEMIRAAKYDKAISLVTSERYEAAISIFEELGDYQDSAEQIANAKAAIEESAYNDAYNVAHDLLSDGYYEEAIDAFSELGDYKDSAALAAKISEELSACNTAWVKCLEGDIEPLKTAIDTHEYVMFDEDIRAIVNFSYPYLGEWEYLSGNAQAFSMRKTDSSTYTTCNSLTAELRFKSDGQPFIFVQSDGQSMDFKINSEEWKIKPVTGWSGGDFNIKLTENDTFVITVDRDDGTVVTCEYQRAAK